MKLTYSGGLHQAYPLMESQPLRPARRRHVLDEVGVQLGAHELQVRSFVRTELVVVGRRKYRDDLERFLS